MGNISSRNFRIQANFHGWLTFPIIWHDAPIHWVLDSPLGYDGTSRRGGVGGWKFPAIKHGCEIPKSMEVSKWKVRGD